MKKIRSAKSTLATIDADELEGFIKVFESAINECPVNFLKYSSNGALLYACWRDASITVHNSNNALPIGSYDDIHEGAITSCDLTSDDLKLFSVDRAQLAVLWDCETGKDIRKINENSIMKSSNFFPSDDNLILYSKLKLFDVKVSSNIILDLRSMETVASIAIPNSIQNVCRWAASDIIATGMDNGTVVFHKFKDLIGRTIDQDGPSHFKSIKMHTDKITHINSSFDKTLLLTTSTDRYCKIFNEKDEEPFLIFNFGDQANSASIHPSLKYLVVTGGQSATEVTKTSQEKGNFFNKFYYLPAAQQFAQTKSHFGTPQCCEFNPDGQSFASGGLDGSLKIHILDSDFQIYEKGLIQALYAVA